MKRLVLFDIDGTLVTSDGAASRAFTAALIDVYGTAGPIGEVSFGGKTDPQIAHELLGRAGLARARVERDLPALWDRYIERFDAELETSVVRALPGVAQLLEAIEACPTEVVIGLLTGNIEPGARRKLDAAGIGFERFSVGVFGSDNEHRNELPSIAIDRAAAVTGVQFEGTAIVIVGDTPADVECGAICGARTVAVATGTFSREALAATEPDFLFDSLADPDVFRQAVMGSSRNR